MDVWICGDMWRYVRICGYVNMWIYGYMWMLDIWRYVKIYRDMWIVYVEKCGDVEICGGRGRSALEAKPQCGPLYIRSPYIKRFKGCSHMTLK